MSIVSERVPEQVRIITVIKSKLKLIEITVKMFDGNLMIRANNGSLEKTPNTFQRVSVTYAAHPFFLPVPNCKNYRLRGVVLRGV
jgi:hypothetical protein